MKIILCLLATCALSANGQTARFRGGDLVISDGSQHIRIAEVSDPPRETPLAPHVQSVKKADGDYYVLVTTSAYTRGFPPRTGFGGGGREYYLTWLHIAKGEVLEKTEQRYQSFAQNREGRIEGWHGSIFTAKTEGDVEEETPDQKNARQTITFTFDAKHPEAGIKEERGEPHG